jgi:hypothetical protein
MQGDHDPRQERVSCSEAEAADAGLLPSITNSSNSLGGRSGGGSEASASLRSTRRRNSGSGIYFADQGRGQPGGDEHDRGGDDEDRQQVTQPRERRRVEPCGMMQGSEEGGDPNGANRV